MKEKTRFIITWIVIPACFIVVLITAICLSIGRSLGEEKTTKIIGTTITESTSTMEQTETVIDTDTATVNDYEIEATNRDVAIANIDEKIKKYLGTDEKNFYEKGHENILGYGLQNCEELRLEESDIDNKTDVLTMTFHLSIDLKDMYMVVEYHKNTHEFNFKIW